MVFSWIFHGLIHGVNHENNLGYGMKNHEKAMKKP